MVSGLHSLLNRNPELAGMATPLVGDLLHLLDQSSDREQLIASLNIVRDTMPVQEASVALARFNRENNSSQGGLRTSESFDAMSAVLERRRGGEGQPLNLTAEESQAITDLFASFQEKLPRARQQNCADRMVSGLHSLLNRNPELAGMAEALVKKVGQLPTETLVDRVATYAPTTPVAEVAAIVQAGRAHEVVSGIDRYRFLSEILADIPQEQRPQIIEGLDRYIQAPDGSNRRQLLNAIFTSTSSDNLGTNLSIVGIELQQLPQVLNDEAVLNLVSVMLDKSAHYRFQLGAILSQIPLTNIPETLKLKLKPIISDSELKIKLGHGHWWLCGEAEPRLERSIRNQAVVLVNGRLLVKFDGKFSALCVETFTTRDGHTFLEGTWYSPTDTETRDTIKGAFDGGTAKISLRGGEWTIMRPLAQSGGKNPEEILEEARQFITKLPDQFPKRIEGSSRREYRERLREEG